MKWTRRLAFLTIISLAGGAVLASVEEATPALFGSVLGVNAALLVIASWSEE